jgi:putative Holliday junction resolvase
MRFLGIDYGTKRIGLALSDEGGRFASPYLVLPAADQSIIAKIKSICEKEGVEKIIIGESRDFKGRPNPVMKKIVKFRERLAAVTTLPLDYEPEFLTSSEARRLPEGGEGEMIKDGLLDARAAALILKSYIDRTNNQ